MEPMTLGSPTANHVSPPSWGVQGGGPPLHSLSLASPPQQPYSPYGGLSGGYSQPPPAQHQHQHQHQTPTQSGFLPGFLMGEPVMSPSSPLRPGITSPSRLSRTLSSPSSAPQTPLPSAHPLRGPQLLKETLNRSTRTPGDKPSGPPTTGLMNSFNRSGLNHSAFGTPDTSGSVFPATPSGAQQQEVQEAGPDPLATWVTVWGFPPSAASFVLQQFGACGAVLQHLMPPNSNWMHIRFQTRLQASKAVGRNSSVLGGSLMVGVAPCREESVLETLHSTTSAAGLDSSVASLNSSLVAGGTPRSIRPLTQAYREAQAEHRVVPGTNTPTRSTGVVSKAMEYMFGW